MAQTDLQDALMEWVLDAPVSRKHFAQELERLLRRVCEDVLARQGVYYWNPDASILQALKDENDG